MLLHIPGTYSNTEKKNAKTPEPCRCTAAWVITHNVSAFFPRLPSEAPDIVSDTDRDRKGDKQREIKTKRQRRINRDGRRKRVTDRDSDSHRKRDLQAERKADIANRNCHTFTKLVNNNNKNVHLRCLLWLSHKPAHVFSNRNYHLRSSTTVFLCTLWSEKLSVPC